MMALLCVVALIDACTDQKDTKGPTFPAGQTGVVNQVFLFPTPGPGGDQITITVVAQSANGRPAEGRDVFMTTTAGRFSNGQSQISGVTDAGGQFSTTLSCDGTNASTVSALVEGFLKTVSVCSAASGATGATGP
ncbi:MAG TPA: Ig-like domain-containing protein [Methylomirabilota bacterium]|nr:Ig-like domain-containing protein [Methylomirabilota bacterium]